MDKQLNPVTNLFGEGFVIDGMRVTIPGSCALSGTILQHIECHGKLVLNETAVVRGNIKANDVVLKGSYEGCIWVKGTVTLTSTAQFRGTISADRLRIEEGAKCNMKSLIDPNADERHEAADLEEEITLYKRDSTGWSSTAKAPVSTNKENKLARESHNKQKNVAGQSDTTDETSKSLEMDRADAPGKVADHFW